MSRLIDRVRTLTARYVSRKNALLVAAIGVTAVAVVLLEVAKPTPEKRVVEEAAWPITAVRAVAGTETPELSLYGRVETPRASTLHASGTGYVAEVRLHEGEWAEEGAVIALLDPVDARLLLERRVADLEEATGNLASLRVSGEENAAVLTHERSLNELAQAKVARHERLRAQKSISAETLNAVLRERHAQAISLARHEANVRDHANRLARAEAGQKRALAMREQAQVALDRTVIRAPFAGRLSAVHVSAGERVGPGTPVAAIFDVARLEIRAQIPSAQTPLVRRALADGRALHARINGSGDASGATLVRLAATVDTGRPGVDGLFQVANPTLELGRAVSMTLSLPPVVDVVRVPIQAIYGQDRLFVVEDDRLLAIPVERMGELHDADGQYSVLVRADRLQAGGLVMTSQLTNAITGLKVEVNEPSPELARVD